MPPRRRPAPPSAFVSAWFSRQMIANAFSRLPTDVRARVRMGDTELFATKEPPSSGATRSISLGGRTFVLTARGEPVSRSSSIAILLGGAVLALMLATFTWARISSERRLVRAHDAERAARERSELLEQIASRLAIAETAHDVATATVAELAASGLDLAALYLRGDAAAERLAAHGSPPDLDVADAAATEAMVAGVTVQVPESKDAGDDALTASGTDDPRLRSLLAVPLFDAKRACVGALVAGSHTDWLVSDMQPVVVGVAEQCVVALERARLRSLDDEVRRRTDILQRLAASLSGAALPTEVAEASVPYLFEAFGAGLVALGVAGSDDVRTLKVPRGLAPEEWRWRPVPRSTSTPTADAMRERRTIELHGRESCSGGVPARARAAAGRRRIDARGAVPAGHGGRRRRIPRRSRADGGRATDARGDRGGADARARACRAPRTRARRAHARGAARAARRAARRGHDRDRGCVGHRLGDRGSRRGRRIRMDAGRRRTSSRRWRRRACRTRRGIDSASTRSTCPGSSRMR